MALTPQDNTGFLREVDEEVRRDQAAHFWKRWGIWIAIAVVLALGAVGGWMWWSNQQRADAEQQAEALSDILEDLDAGDFDDIDARLAELAESSNAGIRAAALFARAGYALQNNERQSAIGYFGEVAGDESLPQQYRDLALIRQTAIEFEDLEPQQVIDRLAGLAEPGNPWFGSAAEMTAIALLQQGNRQEAGTLFAQIAQDESVPQTLRTRSVQMAGVLGVDAVPDEPVDMDEDGQDTVAPAPVPAPEESEQ